MKYLTKNCFLLILVLSGCQTLSVEGVPIDAVEEIRGEIVKQFTERFKQNGLLYVPIDTAFKDVDAGNTFKFLKIESLKNSRMFIMRLEGKDGQEKIVEIPFAVSPSSGEFTQNHWYGYAVRSYYYTNPIWYGIAEIEGLFHDLHTNMNENTILKSGYYSFGQYLALENRIDIRNKFGWFEEIRLQYVQVGISSLRIGRVYHCLEYIMIRGSLGDNEYSAIVPIGPSLSSGIEFVLNNDDLVPLQRSVYGTGFNGSAIIKYLGTTTVVTNSGFIRQVPYFKLLGTL
jgi:hypothetical protein